MNIVMGGFELPIEVSNTYVRTLEIENRILFARVCSSLVSCRGESAEEPYTVWDDAGEEVSASRAILPVISPLVLPWDHRELGGELYTRIEQLVMEDEGLRMALERLGVDLGGSILRATHQVNGDYAFGLEWNVRSYLKAFSFSVNRGACHSILDSLILFLDFAADMCLKRVLVFVNLKLFLEKAELEQVFKRVIFHGLRVILLESACDKNQYENERKNYVDQHFLETC